MKTMHPRRARLALTAILILAAGCGRERRGNGAVEAGATPEDGGVAVVAEGADINQPVTALFNTALDGDLSQDVLNMGLLRGAWKDGELVFETADENPMAIARSYEYVGPDSAALRFHMRSDVKWSDGKPLTARDVVFTYDLVKNPAVASPRQDYVEQLDSVVAQNDSTVTFYFKRRDPQMLSHASLDPMPEHLFGGTAPAQLRSHPAILNPGGGRLVVSGPWMIGEWAKGQRVVLVHNPYFSPKPHLSQLVFRIIGEPTTRIVELRTGNVDMVRGVTTDQIPALEAAGGIRMEKEQKRAYDYVSYSPKGFAPFADPEIRQALTLAIDTKQLIGSLQLQDYAVPASGPYPPIFKLYDPSLMPPVRFDPEKAKQILASKGWKDTDGDGVLDKGGKPFHFTLVTNSGNARRADAAVILQQQWKRIGVDVELQQLEFNTMIANLMQQNYQAALGGWNVGLTPDQITGLYGTGSPLNLTGYSNPRVDSLFAQALEQPTEAAARPYWQRAAAQVARDHPYSWLYYLDTIDPVRDRLRGTKVDTYGPYQNTWEWWIPRGQQGRAATARTDSAQ